ncbi:hypothetical protein [Sphingomonas sp.]|uniref:hypothetical protein n=1 Tax=Sphingomonas sp. TaxID=28214 RepID=UPI0031E204D1
MFKTTGTLIAATVILAASPVEAQESGSNAADAVAGCRNITDSAERLACFDRAAAEFVAARERKDLVVLDRSDVQKTRRSLFGFALPRIKLFGGGDEAEREQVREIDSKVVSAAQVAPDRWSVTLDDKTQWVTLEGARGFPPRAGESVNIKRGALGSYLAMFDKRRSIRVRRTE